MFDENDCCGNGCANCVLDIKPLKEEYNDATLKENIIKNYSEFLLKSKKQLGELLIFELTFISVETRKKSEYTLNIPSGHHVMMRAPSNIQVIDTEKRLLRPYSPFFVDKYELEFKILVNLSPNGQMSKYISNLQIGDNVEFRGPIGGDYFHHSAESLETLVLISQGVAIAPTLPIINEILNNADDMTRIYQFACFMDLKHAYFRKELQEFKTFWNYSSYIYLSRQFCDEKLCLENKGCPDDCKEFKKNLMYKENVFAKRFNNVELLRIVGKNLEKAKFVLCGSREFQNSNVDEIKNLNLEINDENIFLL